MTQALCRRCDRPRSEHTIGDQLCPGVPHRFAPDHRTFSIRAKAAGHSEEAELLYEVAEMDCPRCQGSGKIPTYWDHNIYAKCPDCDGTGKSLAEINSVDWKKLREIACQQTSNGCGFSQITERCWRQLAKALTAYLATRPQARVEAGLVERLRELLAKATPGPWYHYDEVFRPQFGKRRITEIQQAKTRNEIVSWSGFDGLPRATEKKRNANAALIVETINALPALLAALQGPEA